MSATANIALIGLGVHARKAHYPLLEELSTAYPLRLQLIVDLADQEDEIRAWLAGRRLQPDNMIFLDPAVRNSVKLDPLAEQTLGTLHGEGLSHLLVLTEPKAHKPYVMSGAAKGLAVLCEKPVTAFDASTSPEQRGDRLRRDFVDIQRAAADGGATVLIMAPRRLHDGVRLVSDIVTELVDKHGIPITFLDIYHADGMWNMPDEFFTRENHPYKYGYGKLLHSGYHHIDLAARLLSINDRLADHTADTVEVFSRPTRPADFFAQTAGDVYRRLFSTDRFAPLLAIPPENLKGMGETDIIALGRLLRSGRVMTNLVLALMQTSVSARCWVDLPTDLNSGRLTHERITLHVGHLASLHTHSYRSACGNPDGWPFTVQVFRNADLIGGDEYAEFRLDQSSSSSHDLNNTARRSIIESWIMGRTVGCEIASHSRTIDLMSYLYDSLGGCATGPPGLVTRPWRRQLIADHGRGRND